MKSINETRVRVYWNLHKKKYSIQDAKTGRVVDHRSAITLRDCKFSVHKSGLERARREGRKNVHAFITGYYAWQNPCAMWVDGARQVTYNPYKNDTFMREGEPIHTSPNVTMGIIDDMPSVWAIKGE